MISKSSLSQLLLIVAFWVAPFALRFMPLGLIYKPLSLDALILLFLWCAVYILSYVAAYLLAPSYRRLPQRLPMVLNTSRLSKAVILLSGIAFIGGLLLFYEFAIARRYGFSTSVSDIRMLEINAVDAGRKGSIVSGLGRFMMPSLLAAWPLYIILITNTTKRASYLLFASTVLVIWVQAMYEGGRFFLVSLLGVCLFTLFSCKGFRVFNSVRNFFLPVLVTSCVALYSAFVFLERVEDSASLANAFDIFAGTFDVSLSDSGFHILSGPLGYGAFPAYMLLLYVTHPLSELVHILSADSALTTFGGYQFPQFIQLFGVLGFPLSLGDLSDSLSRPGVYVTLIGANYIDFSVLGVIASGIFYGYSTGRALHFYRIDPTSSCSGCAPLLFLCSCFAMVHPLLTSVWPAFVWILFSRVRLKSLF